MADIAQAMRYQIDVKNGLLKQPMTGELMRGDKNANRIIVQLVDGDNSVPLDGVTVTGKFFRGGDGIEIPLEGEANGNEASVLLNEHCYAVDGYFEASVKLTTGTQTRTILTITGNVVSDGEGGILDIENVVPSVADIVAQYQRMQEVTQQTESAGNAAAASAQTAIASAGKANTAAAKIDNMTVSAESGTSAAAAIIEKNGAKHIAFTLPKGEQGEPGNTPYIGSNGNWFVGSEDTGTKAQGPAGQNGTGSGTVTAVTVSGTKYEPDDTGNVDIGDLTGGADLSSDVPQPLGTASAGTSDLAARADHVHKMPKASDVGARPSDWMPSARDVGALPASGTASDSSKLGGKAPEAYAQTEDVLTYEEIQASTDLTGKLPSAKALADGLLYCGAKLLWEYSSSSPQFKEGTLNVPGLSGGLLFAFFTNSGSVCVGSRYNGIGGYLQYNSTSNIVTLAYRYSGSGDNIIIDDNNKGCYGSDGTQWAINQIYRLI